MNEDWGHLGIHSPLTVRRIDVAMQEYRIRFERKQVRRVSYETISLDFMPFVVDLAF